MSRNEKKMKNELKDKKRGLHPTELKSRKSLYYLTSILKNENVLIKHNYNT